MVVHVWNLVKGLFHWVWSRNLRHVSFDAQIIVNELALQNVLIDEDCRSRTVLRFALNVFHLLNFETCQWRQLRLELAFVDQGFSSEAALTLASRLLWSIR